MYLRIEISKWKEEKETESDSTLPSKEDREDSFMSNHLQLLGSNCLSIAAVNAARQPILPHELIIDGIMAHVTCEASRVECCAEGRDDDS
tara:strand:+ start:226 stop:495 length:270 start_codon:yes stop_codon:yes gene_type:complete